MVMSLILRMSLVLGILLQACSSGTNEPLGQVSQAVFPAAGSLVMGGTATGTEYSIVASTGLTGARFVTAGRLVSNGKLGVSLWKIDGLTEEVVYIDGLVTPTLVADKVSVARVDDDHFVVAARGSAGQYYVASFRIAADKITLSSEETAGTISDIAVTTMNPSPGTLTADFNNNAILENSGGNGAVVVAYRGSQNKLGLISYAINEAGTLTQRASIAEAAVGKLAVTWVPGAQPRGAWPSRQSPPSATEENTPRACADASDNDKDGYKNCEDWGCCGQPACDGKDSCSHGTIVVATSDGSNNVKLTSWTVTALGSFTKLGSVNVGAGTNFAIAPSSFRRVATARTSGARPSVELWDIPASGNPTLHGVSHEVELNATDVRIAQGGGSRLFLQFSLGGQGWLQTFEAIDALRAQERILLQGSSAGKFWSKAGWMASITPDRVVLTWPESTDKLHIKAFRDFNMPIIQGQQFTPPVSFDDMGDRDSFQPGFGGERDDMSISVGTDQTLVCGDGRLEVYDREGNRTSSFTAQSLFSNLFDPASGEYNLNRHLTFQHECDPNLAMDNCAKGTCYQNRCVGTIYDVRSQYDRRNQRHVVTASMRFQDSSTAGVGKDVMQRFTAIGVSKTSNPADGFRTFAATHDGKTADNPRLDIANGRLVLGFHWDDNREHFKYKSETLEPAALVFDVGALSLGSADVLNTKVTRGQTESRTSITDVGKTGGHFSPAFFYAYSGGPSLVYYLMPTFTRGLNKIVVGTMALPADGPEHGNGDSEPYLYTSAAGAGPVNQQKGVLYLGDWHSDADGYRRARVLKASVTIFDTDAPAGPTESVDAPGCRRVIVPLPGRDIGANGYHCGRASVVGDTTLATIVYGEYQTGLYSCPSCASGVCRDSATGPCAASGATPRWRYAQYPLTAGSLNSAPSASGILAASSAFDFSGSGSSTGFNTGGLPKTWATVVDPAARSYWTINLLNQSSWQPFVFRTPVPAP